jgi:hypothetical protein
MATVEGTYDRVRITSWASSIIGMTSILELLAYCILELFIWCLADKWTKRLSKDYRDYPIYKKDRRDDPIYRKNVERLIERSRKFEEARNETQSELR